MVCCVVGKSSPESTILFVLKKEVRVEYPTGSQTFGKYITSTRTYHMLPILLMVLPYPSHMGSHLS